VSEREPRLFFSVAERSALPNVVPEHQLSAALTRNQAREYAASGITLRGFA
jgi:hypothetical protein